MSDPGQQFRILLACKDVADESVATAIVRSKAYRVAEHPGSNFGRHVVHDLLRQGLLELVDEDSPTLELFKPQTVVVCGACVVVVVVVSPLLFASLLLNFNGISLLTSFRILSSYRILSCHIVSLSQPCYHILHPSYVPFFDVVDFVLIISFLNRVSV